MKTKIAEIHFKDGKTEEYALNKVKVLEKFSSQIKLLTIRLTTEKNHRTQNHSALCELHFEITGNNFVINNRDRDIERAIDNAVERAKRTLVKHKEKELSKKHRAAIKAKSENLR